MRVAGGWCKHDFSPQVSTAGVGAGCTLLATTTDVPSPRMFPTPNTYVLLIHIPGFLRRIFCRVPGASTFFGRFPVFLRLYGTLCANRNFAGLLQVQVRFFLPCGRWCDVSHYQEYYHHVTSHEALPLFVHMCRSLRPVSLSAFCWLLLPQGRAAGAAHKRIWPYAGLFQVTI